MQWHWHRWTTIYRENVPYAGWFSHQKCKCGADRISEHLDLFSSIGHAIDFGVAVGVYKGFYKFRTGNTPNWEA
jgi:hypothetical protein